jgi:hypothetical protein
LVEAAGIEPASVSPRPSALHAYSVYYLTSHWPDEKGLRGELAKQTTKASNKTFNA